MIELERELALDALAALVGQRAQHSYRLERLLLEIVSLLGVERENLERDFGVGHHQRDDGLRSELAHRLQPMVPVRRPVTVVTPDADNRIEKAPERLDDGHESFDVRLRRIPLVRRRLDAIDGQRGENRRGAAERLAVHRQRSASVLDDAGGKGADRRVLDVRRFRRAQPNRFSANALAPAHDLFLRHPEAFYSQGDGAHSAVGPCLARLSWE